MSDDKGEGQRCRTREVKSDPRLTRDTLEFLLGRNAKSAEWYPCDIAPSLT